MFSLTRRSAAESSRSQPTITNIAENSRNVQQIRGLLIEEISSAIFTFSCSEVNSEVAMLLRSDFQAAPPHRADLKAGDSLLMNRRNMTRRIVLFLALGAWGFLLVSMASFHP